ncbi:hypothetical protein PALU110988_20830 [Paenibacillus lupini]|uniref:hypothetical protein n=1 Tax=Paenibacillus lupini TaxID=1450204 RepID=UPI001422E454|nr:hypothetical protein [Paenibacillus lupini]NIK22245.1 hypothetical protein [Paenibacillus lupini]
MRKFIFLLVAAVFTLISLSGCSKGPSKADVLKELKPAENEKYAIHLFYKDSLPGSETNEVNLFQNSDPAINKAIVKIQFWDHYQERNRKWAKAIGVNEFPMYVLVDADGIVLMTPYWSQLKEFLTESLLK